MITAESMMTADDKHSRAGMALFASLVLLLVFSMLGTAYVRYMTTNLQDTRYALQEIRADFLSQGGIYAAVGEIEAARTASVDPAEEYTFNFQTYRFDREVAREAHPQVVSVVVRDESGRVNLNHAPESLLVALGLPINVVRTIRESGARLASVDDLRTRDFLNGLQHDNLDTSVFTVYTGHDNGASLNLNSASVPVLAAVFNVDDAEAETIAGKRPFLSWQDAVTKVGREPVSFNVLSKPDRSMPDGLSLESNCYRLLSEAFMKTPDTRAKGLQTAVEAVVQLHDEGGYSINYWNEQPPDASYAGVDEDGGEDASIQKDKKGTGSAVTVARTSTTSE